MPGRAGEETWGDKNTCSSFSGLSSVPNTHMAIQNCSYSSSRKSIAFFWLPWALHECGAYTQYKNKWICKYDWWLAIVTYSSISYCWEEKVAFFTLTVVQHSGHQIIAMHGYISDAHKSAYFNTGVLHGAQQINTMHKYISYIHRSYPIKPELRCPNAQKELYLFSA